MGETATHDGAVIGPLVTTPDPVRIGDAVDGGTFVDIDGVPMWHFVGGDPAGTPTVLIHGAFASAATWGAQISALCDEGLHVFVPERSGHGHSPDVAGPWSLAAMARQLITYLETVVEAPAHLVGWSDGAVVALLVARSRPDLVSRMVLACHYVNAAGAQASEFFTRLDQNDPELLEFLRVAHLAASPDGPDYFETVCAKTRDLLSREPDYRVADFSGVGAPTLIVAADQGIARLDHVVELARALPHGRLAVLPGSHILPVESPELFNPLVVSFLAADPPKQWLP